MRLFAFGLVAGAASAVTDVPDGTSAVSSADTVVHITAQAIAPAAKQVAARETRESVVSKTIPFDPRRRKTITKTGKSEASPEKMAVSGSASGKDMDPVRLSKC